MKKKLILLINTAKILEISLDIKNRKIIDKNVINTEISEIVLNENIDCLSYNIIEDRFRYFLRTDTNLEAILLDIQHQGFITALEPNLRVHIEELLED